MWLLAALGTAVLLALPLLLLLNPKAMGMGDVKLRVTSRPGGPTAITLRLPVAQGSV